MSMSIMIRNDKVDVFP